MTDAKKLAITWIELVLLILTVITGMGIWIISKQLVDIWEKTNEPLEVNYQKQANVLNEQATLSAAQSEVTALQAKLTAERVERIKKQYVVDSLTEAQKSQKPPTANADLEKARADLQATDGLIARLSADLEKKLAASTTAQIALETAKRRAATDFGWAQLRFVWNKRVVALKYFGIATGALLLVLWLIVLGIRTVGRFKASPWIVVGGAFVLLTILIAYEVAEIAGAAVIGVLIAIVVLALMPSAQRDSAT